MSRGVNKWIGIGNCCSDPEVRVIQSGGNVANISIACNDGYKDKETGNVIDKTEFVRVVFFNRLAEVAGQYLKKGSKVYIEGSLRTRKWQAQDGTDRYTTEIVAREIQMLGGVINSGASQSDQAAMGSPASQNTEAFDDFPDDDILF